MTNQLFADVFDAELAKDAIINDRHTGHKEDYLLLHSLIRKYQPVSFFEVGTNTGFGTYIIVNAMSFKRSVLSADDIVIYSLDLPDTLAHISQQHPISEGKPKGVGYECPWSYVQLFGDSRRFNFNEHPAEGYFIDAEHTYDNVYIETVKIVLVRPLLIIWHDCDVEEVFQAVQDAMEGEPYELFRVTDTRICYAVKRDV